MGADVIVLVMGVAGSGKSTVGALAARALGWLFVDADDFHSPASLEKLRDGVPLTDEDRRPWLERLAAVVAGARERGEPLVLACSALKRAYRDLLLAGRREDVLLVYLEGDASLLAARMAARTHFMPPSSLPSQLATLEPPGADEAPLVLDPAVPLDSLVAEVVEAVRRAPPVP